VWQRRFWEHHIGDETDLANHVQYCWGNPVKHGLVERPAEWPYSSINRDIARGLSQHPPSHYCDRFSVDTAVFSHDALELLVKVMGTERIMLGSDYPFPLGEIEIGKLVRTASFLDAAAKDAMLGGNAARWLGLQGAAASKAAE